MHNMSKNDKNVTKIKKLTISKFKHLKSWFFFEKYKKKVIGQQHSDFFCFVFFSFCFLFWSLSFSWFFFLFSIVFVFVFFFLFFFFQSFNSFLCNDFLWSSFFAVSLFWSKTWICKSQERALLVERWRPRGGRGRREVMCVTLTTRVFGPPLPISDSASRVTCTGPAHPPLRETSVSLLDLRLVWLLKSHLHGKNPFLPASLSSPECSTHTFQTHIRTVSWRLSTAF